MEITFGERLKILREKNNVKQEELAKMLNLSQQTISNWEKGKVEPDLNAIKKITSFFNVSFDELLGNSEVQHVTKTTIPATKEPPTIGEKVNALPERERLIIEALLASWEVKKGKDEPSPIAQETLGKQLKDA
jgi:transcriptional regulator with XRE-family HTH domain